jgi:hypothetical protein
MAGYAYDATPKPMDKQPLTELEQRFINRLTLAGKALSRDLSTKEKALAVDLARRGEITSTDPDRKLVFYYPKAVK